MAKKQLIRLNKDGLEGKGLELLGQASLGEIIEGTCYESAYNFFTDSTAQFMTGVWECQAGTMKLTDYPFDEYCQIIGCAVKPRRSGRGYKVRMPEAFLGVS
ncbi:MAG: hypothetical protein KGI54_05725 [Pseudomonadota bacterium]|nr:hypothetical protein [Pseudomonadota bacterium]